MKNTVIILILMFVLGGLAILGLNKLSSKMYNDTNSLTNYNKISQEFVVEPSKNDNITLDDNELEKHEFGEQIFFKGIEKAYKIISINEVETIKERISSHIHKHLNLKVNECEVKSINLEDNKIIFNIHVLEYNFSVIGTLDDDRLTNIFIQTIENMEDE